MASNVSTFKAVLRMLPFLAIVRYEFRTLLGSWLVRLWIAGSVLFTFALLSTNWAHLPTPLLIAVILFPYLVLPWFLVVTVLAVDPVAGARVETLVDGILSRPVTRHEYLLASWTARVMVVLGGYLAVAGPATALVCLARRSAPLDAAALYGTLAALAIVALVLVLQVSLGLLVGTLVRRPLVAVVLLLFFWGSVNVTLDQFALKEFSPLSLSRELPALIRRPWRTAEATAGDAATDLAALARQTTELFNMFGPPAEQPREARRGFFERSNAGEFSVLKVLLGYGLPAAACLGLATAAFSLRDL